MGVASNLLHQGRYEEARERLHDVFDIAPNDGIRSGVLWALSATYVDEGDFDKALSYRFSSRAMIPNSSCPRWMIKLLFTASACF